MTPVLQTKLVGADGYGTCWTACLASILDLPERAVPHFANPEWFGEEMRTDIEAFVNTGDPLNWWTATNAWLLMLGYRLWLVYTPVLTGEMENSAGDEHLIVSGLSPRSPGADGKRITHSTVWSRQPDGSFALSHDPYPGGTGIVGKPFDAYAVRPHDWEPPEAVAPGASGEPAPGDGP